MRSFGVFFNASLKDFWANYRVVVRLVRHPCNGNRGVVLRHGLIQTDLPNLSGFLTVQLTKPSIGLDNGLAPNRPQAIISNNAVPIHWRIYAALGADEIMNTFFVYMACKPKSHPRWMKIYDLQYFETVNIFLNMLTSKKLWKKVDHRQYAHQVTYWYCFSTSGEQYPCPFELTRYRSPWMYYWSRVPPSLRGLCCQHSWLFQKSMPFIWRHLWNDTPFQQIISILRIYLKMNQFLSGVFMGHWIHKCMPINQLKITIFKTNSTSSHIYKLSIFFCSNLSKNTQVNWNKYVLV